MATTAPKESRATFSLQSRSSFGHCEDCGRPVVHVAKRRVTHSCGSSPSRRSSAASGWLPTALLNFLFRDKSARSDETKPRIIRRETLLLTAPRSLTINVVADVKPKERRGSVTEADGPDSAPRERQSRNSVA